MTKSRIQVGALCLKIADKSRLHVLLVTSRDTGRWVIPKGWPENGDSLSGAALREAFEEAGVRGTVGASPIGKYSYPKREKNSERELDVSVYLLFVNELAPNWPEEDQRERRWFDLESAAKEVDEPELSAIMMELAGNAHKWDSTR